MSKVSLYGDEPEAPDYLLNPASIKPIKSVDEFNGRANKYFNNCEKDNIRATITGFCLAVGLPGPTSLIRLGQRLPELRYAISCCMTAVAHGYEQMIGAGNSTGPMFMLKNIPDFDPEEQAGAPGVQFFNDKKEILLSSNVSGAATEGEEYDGDVDPIEVYLSVIKNPAKAITIQSSEPNEMLSKSPIVVKRPMRLFQIIDSAKNE